MPNLATLKPLTNRSADSTSATYALPEDGFVQLVPLGEAPNFLGKQRIIQVTDHEALTAMLNSLLTAGAEMLIDDDHLSHDADKSTDANGWHLANKDTLQLRADGLYGLPRWTSLGLEKLIGGVKRYISPEFDPATVQPLGGNRYRVTRLVGLALTNRPNFRALQKPLTNSGRLQQPADNTEVTTMHTALLALALGLPETDIANLDEPTLRQKVQDLRAKLEAADKTSAEAATLKNKAADDFVAQHAKLLSNKEVAAHVRETFLTNRAVAEAIIAGMTPAADDLTPEQRARAAKAPLHNRAAAQTPAEADAEKEAKQSAVIKNRAQELLSTSGGKRRFSECFDQARSEITAQ